MQLLEGEELAYDDVLARLAWMQAYHIWPNGPRYLWTDAFGVVLLVSMYHHTGERRFLELARWVVDEVERVLGRPRGIRAGESPDHDGQYFHYLTKWIFALDRLGRIEPVYKARAVELVKEIHPAFVIPGRGVWWKMREDLSGPYPGCGLGALDAFDGYVMYRLLDDEHALTAEMHQMHQIVEHTYADLHITQDLALGMMLWLTHVFPDEPWALVQRERCLDMLRIMWIEPPGYFCREPNLPHVRYAFTNYGVSLGLQAVGALEERVPRLERFFHEHRSADELQSTAITHVMACTSLFPGDFLVGHRHGATPERRLRRI